MTYYAKHNGVGTADHLPEGAIEITAQRYKELLALQASGLRVTVIDGEAVEYAPPVYRPDGAKASEYTPGDELITEAPPTDLHVPAWENGEWVEAETAEQKQSREEAEAKAEKEKLRQQLKDTRDTSLQDIVHDFLDGRVVQVRPQDLANFQLAIANGVSREWVMADNSVAVLTVAEMQTAMQSGIAQGEVIWDAYIAKLKLL